MSEDPGALSEAEPEAPVEASLDEQPDWEALVVVLSAVPERIADVTSSLEEEKLRYRHGPAFPTLRELIEHLALSGTRVDALLRHAYIDHQQELDVRVAIDPRLEPEGTDSAGDLLDNFHRVRRRTVDMLRGLTAEDWVRTIEDPGQGPVSLLEVTRQITHHESAHLAQIRNLIAVLPEPQDLGPIGRAPRARMPVIEG